MRIDLDNLTPTQRGLSLFGSLALFCALGATAGAPMKLQLDRDQQTILRMALDNYVEAEHRKQHIAMTGGDLGYEWPADKAALLRRQFADNAGHRQRVALAILDQLDQAEMATEQQP